MSLESAKSFIERINADEDFKKKVTACKDKKARIAFAKLAGYDFTPEEIIKASCGLRDEDLDKMAGAGSCSWYGGHSLGGGEYTVQFGDGTFII